MAWYGIELDWIGSLSGPPVLTTFLNCNDTVDSSSAPRAKESSNWNGGGQESKIGQSY